MQIHIIAVGERMPGGVGAGWARAPQALAGRIEKLLGAGNDLALLVGGPEGLAPECLAAAHERWSLSKLTLAHPVVTVLLAEQLYRALTILRDLPYHRL